MNKKHFRAWWYSLSAKQRYWVRYVYHLPADITDQLLGKRTKYVPPRGLIYTGSAAGAEKFLASSKHQLHVLKAEIDLRPTDHVLDIGSGIGRTAISLVEYLSPEACYEGFDVVKSGVDWCNKKIGRDFPNFNFTYVPLFNDLYNTSKGKATEFEFPYDHAQFDKVYSFSVFTHMMVDEVQHYLTQINRVLNSGGQAMSTFFLYDDDNESFIASKEGFAFPVAGDGYRLMNTKVTSGNIAIHKDLLEQMMSQAGLQLQRIADGFWKGTQDAKEYQDIVVFKRK